MTTAADTATTEFKAATATAVEPYQPPDTDAQPSVAAVRGQLAALDANLAAVRADRRAVSDALAAVIGVVPNVNADPHAMGVEARLMALGKPTDDVAKFRELSRRLEVTEAAIGYVTKELAEVRTRTVNVLRAEVRERAYLPAVRAVTRKWLETVRDMDDFRHLILTIERSELGRDFAFPFVGRVPVSLSPGNGIGEYTRFLVEQGFTTRAEAEAVLPGVFEVDTI